MEHLQVEQIVDEDAKDSTFGQAYETLPQKIEQHPRYASAYNNREKIPLYENFISEMLEDAGARDFFLGGRYGNEIARAMVVQTNSICEDERKHCVGGNEEGLQSCRETWHSLRNCEA